MELPNCLSIIYRIIPTVRKQPFIPFKELFLLLFGGGNTTYRVQTRQPVTFFTTLSIFS
jgi:hypothetical protein